MMQLFVLLFLLPGLAFACKVGFFDCEPNGLLLCIPQRWVCDGDDDCPNATDEKNCNMSTTIDPETNTDFTTSSSAITPTSTPSQQPLPSTQDDTRLYQSSCTRDQFRCDNGECISQAEVCDEIPDCSDESDEGGDCDACANMTCQGECQNTPKGGQCQCRFNETLSKDKMHCESPCSVFEHLDCEHFCLPNGQGGYKCACNEGFVLRSDTYCELGANTTTPGTEPIGPIREDEGFETLPLEILLSVKVRRVPIQQPRPTFFSEQHNINLDDIKMRILEMLELPYNP